MLIGLISDTHDNIRAIEEAVNIFNGKNVELILHAGDYNSPFTARIFRNLKVKLIGVYGNIDGEREGLKNGFSEIGAEINGIHASLNFNDRKLALYHGNEQFFLEALIKSGQYDVVIHGHTHNRRYERIGSTTVLNPGEACGYLTGEKSIAILNLENLTVDFVSF
ncbi:MAG: metallophosphoesterase [Nitrososphaeraceae archaeon]|nr:metallophosphoesterase [Nitrososphaeraceae archaeon]